MEQMQEKTESALLNELAPLSRLFEKDIDHRILSYNELVKTFHQYMPFLLRYSPLNLYANPLSNFIRKYIGDEIPGCIQEEYKRYEDSLEFRNDMTEIRAYYKDLMQDKIPLSKEEFNELLTLALIDDKNNQEFVKYLLGQIIERNVPVKKAPSIALINCYFRNLLSINELYCQRNKMKNEDIDNHFHSKVISSLYSMYYGLWRSVQQSKAYSPTELIEIFKVDEYFRQKDESYYHENATRYAKDIDCHLMATTLLTEFLSKVSPTTYEANKDWLFARIDTCFDKLHNRQRIVNGTLCNIDELFTIQKEEEKKAEISSDNKLLQLKRINV